MEPRKLAEIQAIIGLKHRETFLNNYIKPLLKEGVLSLTIPDKPQSSKQRYVAVKK